MCVYSASLDYFTTHADLVKRQKDAVEKKQMVRKGLVSDTDWTGEGLAKETETMVSN
jgi:dihydropyrimidine dehydrogenase (NADP+)